MNKTIILAGLIGLLVQCETHQLIPDPEVGPISSKARESATAQRYLAPLPYAIVKTLNIPYGKSVNDKGRQQTQLLDLYQLDNDPLQARPVIILIHGGGFTSGDKSEMANYANLYAQYGYLTVSINYRLSTKKFAQTLLDLNCVAAVDDAKEDAFGAIRWLRANAAQFRIDKGRIGILGYSAGAVTALSVDFDQKTQRRENSAALDQSTAISTIVEMAGVIDPTLINPTGKPLRIINGVNDPGMKFQYATEMYKVCQANRVPVVLQSTAGGHDMAPYFQEIASGTLPWFKTYLVDAKPVN